MYIYFAQIEVQMQLPPLRGGGKRKKNYHTVNKSWSQQSVAVAAAAHYRARYFVHLSAPHCPQEVRH